MHHTDGTSTPLILNLNLDTIIQPQCLASRR